MRDLDRGRPRSRVAVEGEQARAAERVDRLCHRLLVDLDRAELAPVGAATGVLCALSERDQSQEELPGCILGGLAQPRVDLLGATGERSRDSAHRLIGGTQEDAPLAALVQLGQCVLEQRERAGLVRDVGDHLREQARLERRADALGRPRDRTLELVGPQRHDRLDVVAEQLGEAAVEQRPVVEVGSQRGHDAQPAMGIGDRSLEHREEVRSPLVVFDQCEDLLELVENEHELRVVARQDPLQRAQEPPLAVLELLEQTGRRSVGHPEQRRLELLERIGAGEHLDDPPGLRAGQRSAPKRRHEPGPDHRRLAAPARADDGEKAGLAEAVDQVLGQRLASEEVGGIRLLEGTQALVRIPRLQAFADVNGHGTERAPERDVLREVLELRADVDHVDRVGETLEPDRAALDVLDPVHLARQVRDLAADEDLRWACEAGQPRGKVECSAAIAAVHPYGLTGVEADPDGQRLRRIGDRLVDEREL